MIEEEVVFSDDMSLGEARLLLNMMMPKGTVCPCCEQPVKIHKISMSPASVLGLVHFYKEYGEEWGDLQVVKRLRGATVDKKESKLRYWNLLERQKGVSGPAIYRVPVFGQAWIASQVKVPRYAFTFNQQLIGHDGDEIGILDIITEEQMREILL